MADFLTHFVSQKVNKIRALSSFKNLKSEYFATGGWDNEISKLSLWRIGSSDIEPVVCVEHEGDVMGLEVVGADLLATASSAGSVSVFKIVGDAQALKAVSSWPELHCYGSGAPAACTGVASRDTSLASVGADGSVNLLDITRPRQPVRQFRVVDGSSINAVTWLTQNEVVAVNTCGQLKQYDFRLAGRGLARSATLSSERTCLTCVATHPSQSHVVTTASQHGLLFVCDMRQDVLPSTVLDAHNGNPVWEILFHPQHPQNLFTCSEDGSVWHWTNSSSAGDGTGSSWLLADASKHRIEVSDLLAQCGGTGMLCSVNSLSILEDTDTLLCGTDNESVCVISSVAIRC